MRHRCAQTVARATGNQIEVMMLQGVNATIGNLINQTGQAFEPTRREDGREFAQPYAHRADPVHVWTTFQAAGRHGQLPPNAIATMGATNKLIEAQLRAPKPMWDRVRRQQARAAALWWRDTANGEAVGFWVVGYCCDPGRQLRTARR